MDENILSDIEKELNEISEKARLLSLIHISYDTKTNANILYTTIKHDLILLLNQINPVGNTLINLIEELDQNVSVASQSEVGNLVGYVSSAQTILKKLRNGQLNFGKNTFSPNKFSNKVFIVHGHDSKMLIKVKNVLKELDLEPIVLHEQPNKGRTIIEKFLDYSDVGFSIVLLSPDDKTLENGIEHLRARQNVIFELGFFIGKLGRERVVALYRDTVQIPSDYNGVLYVQYNDSDTWKFQLVKEFKAVGFNIDLNKLI